MKSLVLLLFLLGLAKSISSRDRFIQCEAPIRNVSSHLQPMESSCVNAMLKQIQVELKTSMTYFAMASYFLQDKINRPGFAKLFLDSANEKRQHAIKLMEYIMERVGSNERRVLNDVIRSTKPQHVEWESGEEALRDALSIGTDDAKSIRELIRICESSDSDVHLIDWLSGDKSQQELASKISALGRVVLEQGTIGEFLYDRTLL